jgi:hypothetical protein
MKYLNGFTVLLHLLDSTIHPSNYEELIQFFSNKDIIDLNQNDYYYQFYCKSVAIATSTRSFMESIRQVSQKAVSK